MRTNLRNSRRVATRRATLLTRLLAAMLTLGGLFAAACIHHSANLTVGRAGIIGAAASGWAALDCGGTYDAGSLTIVTTVAGCGAKVWVTNPATSRSVLAIVAGTTPAYDAGNGRVADLSVATATALGIKDMAMTVVRLSPAGGARENIGNMLPLIPAALPAAKAAPLPDAKSLRALTLNFIGECGRNVCDRFGRLATAMVVLNRTAQDSFGAKDGTIHSVVWARKQFSWTHLNPKQVMAQENTKLGKAMRQEALDFLQDNLSGDALALQYVLADADHYYAFDVMATPKWGRHGGRLEVVPMPNVWEVQLKHRYFRERGIPGVLQVARLAS